MFLIKVVSEGTYDTFEWKLNEVLGKLKDEQRIVTKISYAYDDGWFNAFIEHEPNYAAQIIKRKKEEAAKQPITNIQTIL